MSAASARLRLEAAILDRARAEVYRFENQVKAADAEVQAAIDTFADAVLAEDHIDRGIGGR